MVSGGSGLSEHGVVLVVCAKGIPRYAIHSLLLLQWVSSQLLWAQQLMPYVFCVCMLHLTLGKHIPPQCVHPSHMYARVCTHTCDNTTWCPTQTRGFGLRVLHAARRSSWQNSPSLVLWITACWLKHVSLQNSMYHPRLLIPLLLVTV